MATSQQVQEVCAGIVGAVGAFVAWAVQKLPEAVEWVACTAAATAKRAVEKARCAYAVGAAAFRVAVLHRFMMSHGFLVHKVVALNETDGTDAIVTRAFEPSNWEERVRVKTGWLHQDLRVEVRYLCHGKKFRLLLRPGDACTLSEPPERHRGGPKGVMAAELVGADTAVDVTKRVQKYQGPARDFHRRAGLRVAVTDLFPLNDLEELRGRFEVLRIVDAHINKVEIPLDCSDLGAALGV